MYICIFLQKCIYVYIFRNVFMYKSTEMYICIFLQKCIYVYIYRNVYMYISTEMYICIHLQNCKYVYIYRNVYTTINTNLHKCIMYIPQRGNSGVSFNYTLLKELSLCHKFKLSNPHISATCWCKSLIFQTSII